MDLKIDISPATIEKEVTQAIVGSSIGKRIKENVDKALQDYQIDSAIEDECRGVIRRIVGELLNADPEFNGRIRKAVAGRLTDDLIRKAVTTAFDKLDRSW